MKSNRGEARSRWERYGAFTVALALSLPLLGAFMVISNGAAFQDLGEWTYQGYVGAWLLRGGESDVAQFMDHPVPYALAQAVLTALQLVLLPVQAAVVYTLVYVLVAAVAIQAVVNRHSLVVAPSAVALTFAVTLSSGFWNGYVGNQLGMILFLVYLGLPRDRSTRWWVVAVFSLLMFFAHALAYAAWGLVALSRAVADRKVPSFLLGVAPSISLGLWYVMSTDEGGGATLLPSQNLAVWLAYKAYTVTKLGGYHNLQVTGATDADWSAPLYWAGVSANVIFAGLLVFGVGALLWHRRSSLHKEADLIALIGLVGVTLLLPPFLGVVNPGERLLGPAMSLFVVLGFGKRSRLVPRMIAAALVVGAVLTTVSVFGLPHKAARGVVRDVPSGISLRADLLYAHRTDQFAAKVEHVAELARVGAPPDLPLAWETSLLEAPNRPGAEVNRP